MIFQHISKEKDLWRGWLKNGQSVELSRSRHGWDFGAGVHIHSNDSGRGNRMLFLKFWRLTAVLPLGVIDHPWPAYDGPQWSVYASAEFDLSFRWGKRSKSFAWPWRCHVLSYEKQLPDGSWVETHNFDVMPYIERYPFTYVLRNGEVQERNATVHKRRFILCRRAFRAFGWPQWVEESIDVEFDGEVGERSGSWKGGTIGCSYDILPGETLLETLRRMERERKFT